MRSLRQDTTCRRTCTYIIKQTTNLPTSLCKIRNIAFSFFAASERGRPPCNAVSSIQRMMTFALQPTFHGARRQIIHNKCLVPSNLICWRLHLLITCRPTKDKPFTYGNALEFELWPLLYYVNKQVPPARPVPGPELSKLVATLLALGASPAGETPKTLERLQRAMASRHALLHVHASLDPNVAIRFVFWGVKLCTIV